MSSKDREKDNTYTINTSVFNKGGKIMVNCPGERLYGAVYQFDSMMNLKFEVKMIQGGQIETKENVKLKA